LRKEELFGLLVERFPVRLINGELKFLLLNASEYRIAAKVELRYQPVDLDLHFPEEISAGLR